MSGIYSVTVSTALVSRNTFDLSEVDPISLLAALVDFQTSSLVLTAKKEKCGQTEAASDGHFGLEGSLTSLRIPLFLLGLDVMLFFSFFFHVVSN
jgi:hypothetical protein